MISSSFISLLTFVLQENMRNVKAEHDEYVVYRKEPQDVIPIVGIIVIFGYPQARYTAVFFACILEE